MMLFFHIGKYGVIVASKETKSDASDTAVDTTAVRLNLCHHIIGMNPLSIGQLTEKDIAKFSEKSTEFEQDVNNSESNQQNAQAVEEPILFVQSEQKTDSELTSDEQTEGQEAMDSELKESNITELLFQSYLMDPSVTVGEMLFKSGIEVLAFERFECGETAEVSQDVAVAASA